jgi:L-aminopeptidase/D-esterase-like protein
MFARSLLALFLLAAFGGSLSAQKPRERDLNLPIGGTPGRLDAITDVAGVEVGSTTLVSGSGPLVVGKGPVRTGVTVVHPRGKANHDPVFAAWFTLNGNGEMTGTTWIEESGMLEGPIAITNTHSVGVVRDAIIQWENAQKNKLQPWWLPVVAETYDGSLNDINGMHVKAEHVFAALDNATAGLPQEGAVGGGTGMVCHQFKGGIGTASRRLTEAQGGYTVGVLVQCNYGSRRDLRIAGVPVGEEIADLLPCSLPSAPSAPNGRRCGSAGNGDTTDDPELGSIIVVVATRRAAHAASTEAARYARCAGHRATGRVRWKRLGRHLRRLFDRESRAWNADPPVKSVQMIPNDRISPLFYATVQATEAAITNALLAAETTTGSERLSRLRHAGRSNAGRDAEVQTGSIGVWSRI